MPSPRKRLGNVLVVEDDPLIALTLEQALREAGAREVMTTGRADEALELLKGKVPQVLVLDLSLGDSDEGFGVAEIALQIFTPPPLVIFSTGSPERIPAHLARRCRVFAKPYDPAELAGLAAAGV